MRANLRWLLTAGLVFLGFLSGPSQLRSQGLTDFEVNLFGGTVLSSGKDLELGPPQFPQPEPFRFELDSSGRWGVRVNFLTADWWGTEVYYGLSSRTASFIKPTVTFDLPVDNHELGMNFLYYPVGNGYPLATSSRLTPFITGGVGVSIVRPTAEAQRIASDPLLGFDAEIIESKEVAYSYGAGVKYRLNRIFGVRGDVRGSLSANPSFGLPRESSQLEPVIPKAYMHSVEISAGVIINFGSRP